MSKVNIESRKFKQRMTALKLSRINNIIGDHIAKEKKIYKPRSSN